MLVLPLLYFNDTPFPVLDTEWWCLQNAALLDLFVKNEEETKRCGVSQDLLAGRSVVMDYCDV